jgi:hypothetical protein
MPISKIGTNSIANSAITLTKLAANSVNGIAIVDSTITDTKFATPPASTGKAIAMSIVFGG